MRNTSFLHAPLFKGLSILSFVIKPKDSFQKCGTQQFLLYSGNCAWNDPNDSLRLSPLSNNQPNGYHLIEKKVIG
jgi:hypothetical protein